MKFIYFIIVALLVSSCSQAIRIKSSDFGKINEDSSYIRTVNIEVDSDKGAAANEPEIEILSPKEGEILDGSKVVVLLNISNFRLVAPDRYPKKGHGHVQVWMDGIEFQGWKTEFVFENQTNGTHTIKAELVMSNNTVLPYSKTISIIVKKPIESPPVSQPKNQSIKNVSIESNAAPKAEQQQTSSNEFTVEADDNGFYPSTINAKNGEVKINFKFRDDSIYFAGLDIKGPFQTLHYKLNDQQPLTTAFALDGSAKIDSYWPSSGVHKSTLIVKGR